jgi:hypothetical protein
MQTTSTERPHVQTPAEPTPNDQRREQAIKRIEEKNGFKMDLVSYVVVNAMLVLIWAITGVGYFWPIWVIGLWGVGVVLHGYAVYRGNQYTEEQIEREMKSMP